VIGSAGNYDDLRGCLGDKLRANQEAGHILEHNLLRGFPPEKVGSLRATLDSLKSEGIVRPKPTKHGPAVFLDPAKSNETYEQLRKHYSWLPKPPWMTSQK